jgi:hypothetical protein
MSNSKYSHLHFPPEDEEFLMATEDIVQQLKDEGSRSRGQTDLLTIYRARFGSVPRKIRAAIERTRDDAALTKWVEIFVTRSAAEIAAAVTKK